jgi:hypothetical protein
MSEQSTDGTDRINYECKRCGETFVGGRWEPEFPDTESDHPRARNGRALSGVCDNCDQPICGWEDHADDCPLYRALEGSD